MGFFKEGDIVQVKHHCSGSQEGKNYKLISWERNSDRKKMLWAAVRQPDPGENVRGCNCEDNWKLVSTGSTQPNQPFRKGDRVRCKSDHSITGIVESMPGMIEYDTAGYVAPSTGFCLLNTGWELQVGWELVSRAEEGSFVIDRPSVTVQYVDKPEEEAVGDKFKVGDKVICVGKLSCDPCEGVVEGIRPGYTNRYKVRIIKSETKSEYEGSDWNYPEANLTLIGKSNQLKSKKIKKEKPKAVILKSIILDQDKKDAIKAILETHNPEKSKKIWERWGFNKTIEKGRGMALLFHGTPGTGKTKCAEVIAEDLGLKLKMVATDELWSSEPGATERTLKQIFKGADKSKTLLCFDECDSLVYDRRRTGVILSAETNCLLSQLERYDGIVIFTTNRTPVLDPAFQRRLQLKIEFPPPTRELRIQIWQTLIPKKAPLHKDVCIKTLSLSELAGGNIKNVIINAARMAIMKKSRKIVMAHFESALKSELQGMAAFADNEEDAMEQAGITRSHGGFQKG